MHDLWSEHAVSLILMVLTALGAVAVFLPAFAPPSGTDARPSWLAAAAPTRWAVVFLGTVIELRLLAGVFATESPGTWLLVWGDVSDALIVLALTAIVFRLIAGVERVTIGRVDLHASDNLQARALATQTRILSRAAQTAVVVIGLGVLLMSFDGARKLGASLLASAGIASLAIGLAARPALENLIAGIQIALTQPIRLDDVVIVENEWGRIEEIASTYVVVRIWDDRRLIVPLRYFLENTFQNWTRTTSNLLGTVFVQCAFEIDVDAVRAELKRVCEASQNWDARVCNVQVTDLSDRSVQLRALVSAANSSKLWDLRVEVREALTRFLSRQGADAIPRGRFEFAPDRYTFSGSQPKAAAST